MISLSARMQFIFYRLITKVFKVRFNRFNYAEVDFIFLFFSCNALFSSPCTVFSEFPVSGYFQLVDRRKWMNELMNDEFTREQSAWSSFVDWKTVVAGPPEFGKPLWRARFCEPIESIRPESSVFEDPRNRYSHFPLTLLTTSCSSLRAPAAHRTIIIFLPSVTPTATLQLYIVTLIV